MQVYFMVLVHSYVTITPIYIVQQHKFVNKSESHCQILAPTHIHTNYKLKSCYNKCSHIKTLMLLVKITESKKLYYSHTVQ